MEGRPLERIYEEVAFIAYYFHWQHDEVMMLPHKEREKWCEQISRINKNLSGGTHDKGEHYTMDWHP
ncbi:MAG: hypothetical protein GY765_14405 [bacterium]|nr:hypothetical protein [bacterium]